jgi:hypothetical protein
MLASWEETSNQYKRFPKNPRLPVNRGFFVKQTAAGTGGKKKGKDMNADYRKVPAEFGPETRFVVEPVPATPFRAVQEDRLEKLKARLLAERLAETWEPEANSQVRRAANEATALAWLTQYPLLVFPVLFDEKAEAAARVAARQRDVRQRSRTLLAL